MAGLVPAIHDLQHRKDVDARDKPGHDELRERDAPAPYDAASEFSTSLIQ
jgi:hypothetical protein